MRNVLLCLAAITGTVLAQQIQTFPEGAVTPNAAELKQHLQDRVFTYKLSSGTPIRVQYNANGYVFVNGPSYQDSGEWKAEEGRLCGSLQKAGAFCNDARMSAGVLFFRRMNGEIIRYDPQ
jgi:hypothetical protein